MSEIEILCLANSWKRGGRCIAGLTRDGEWIRPVSETEDGEISEENCMLDIGRPAAPLDVLRIPIKAAAPRPYQPENWAISNGTWKFLRSRKLVEVQEFLESSVSKAANLFGNKDNKVTWEQIQHNPPRSSLALVKAGRPAFKNYPKQRRCIFTFRKQKYDLPITFDFDLPLHGENVHESESDWFLTISLGEPWDGQGNACYKLIAGALEIPK